MNAAPVALHAVTPEALVRALPGATLAEARKLVSAVHRRGSLERVPQVRRAVLDQAAAVGALPRLVPLRTERSAVDPFAKVALETPGGGVVEAVRIPLERAGRFQACVSSQVGCGLACAFCATGRMGLGRNLEAWEILEQVRAVAGIGGTLGGVEARLHGVLFQGMGEPLANLDAVLDAIRVLREPCAFAVDARNITVCTAGIPAGIERLGREAPKVRLALSIHAARAETRRRLMPIDRAHPLADVLEAAREHGRLTGIDPLWVVTLLAGVNDSPDDARALVELARDFVGRGGRTPRFSVVAYNRIALNDPFARSAPDAELEVRRILGDAGFSVHRRYSGGGDIAAACGQLAAREPRNLTPSA